MEMFWYGVRSQTGVWGGNIGIRKGWEVVRVQPESNDLLSLIKRHLTEE